MLCSVDSYSVAVIFSSIVSNLTTLSFMNVVFFCLPEGTVRRFLEKYGDSIDTIVFAVTSEDEASHLTCLT